MAKPVPYEAASAAPAYQPDRLLTPAEVCQFLNISTKTLDRMRLERPPAISYVRVRRGFRYETETKEASVQAKLQDALIASGGSMSYRDLEKKLSVNRLGSTLWFQARTGLVKDGRIQITGSGKTGDPKIVRLLRIVEDDDEE